MSIPFGPIGSVYGDMYARGLGAALRGYRLYDLDYALQQDPEAYERMRRDPVVEFALHYRKLLAAGDSWFLEVKPLDEKGRLLVKIFTTLLNQVERFPSVRYNLAEAAIKGSAWAKIWPEQRIIDVPGLGKLPWTIAARVQDVDKRRLRQFPIDLLPVEREITVENPWATQTSAQAHSALVQLSDVQREWVWQIYRPLQQRWEEIDRNQFIRHVYQDREDALGYGTGLAGTLYTFWWAKEQVLSHGLEFVERWAQGLVKVGLSTLRDGLASTPSAQQRQNTWLTVFETMRTRNILVYDKDDELDVVPPPTDGWTVITEALAYLDGAIRVAVLGASLPTEQEVEGGSFAMAKVQQSATDAVIRFDRVLLEETITRDLIGFLWDENYAMLEALGLTDRDPPRLKVRDAEHYDPKVRAEVIKAALDMGMDVLKEEAYTQLALTPPAPEDDVLKGGQQLTLGVQGIPGFGGTGPKDPGAPPPNGPEGDQPPGGGQQRVGNQGRKPVGEGESSVAEKPQSAKAFAVAVAREFRERYHLETPVPPQPIHVHLPPQKAPVVHAHFAAPPPPPTPPPPRSAAPPKIDVSVYPQITIEPSPPPNVTVPVTVEVKGAEKKLTIERDGFGRITGAESKPKE